MEKQREVDICGRLLAKHSWRGWTSNHEYCFPVLSDQANCTAAEKLWTFNGYANCSCQISCKLSAHGDERVRCCMHITIHSRHQLSVTFTLPSTHGVNHLQQTMSFKWLLHHTRPPNILLWLHQIRYVLEISSTVHKMSGKCRSSLHAIHHLTCDSKGLRGQKHGKIFYQRMPELHNFQMM